MLEYKIPNAFINFPLLQDSETNLKDTKSLGSFKHTHTKSQNNLKVNSINEVFRSSNLSSPSSRYRLDFASE